MMTTTTQEHIDSNVILTTNGNLHLPEYADGIKDGDELHTALVERLGGASQIGAEGSGWTLDDDDVSPEILDIVRGEDE